MGKINLWRVFLGGIIAGLVIDLFEWVLNGVILNAQLAENMRTLGKSGTVSLKQIAALNVLGLVAGIVMVLLYAAIRPRFGPGPKTAMFAGLAVWALAYVLGGASLVVMHLFPMGLITIALAVQVIETLVAAVAGAAVYKED